MDEMDHAFKALADPHRRLLLDHLQARDGQTLGELCAHLPAMTRFGCMKHLKILEEAGLVATRKVGREKFHYLNPVPIQQLYDRWVGKYAQPWTRALTGLKDALEEDRMGRQPAHIYEVFIRTTPERLWQALTDGELTRQYYFGSRVETDWRPGSRYAYPNPDGGIFVEGEVLEVDPPRRLVATFRPTWRPEAASAPPMTVTWEITPVGDACKLTLIHDGFDPATPLGQAIIAGWTQIISGLKTLLETGEPLTIDGAGTMG